MISLYAAIDILDILYTGENYREILVCDGWNYAKIIEDL